MNGAIASEISLLEAIEAGIIYPPKYIVPDFIREDELTTVLEKIESAEDSEKEKLKAEYDELVKKSDKTKGVPDLLEENITEQYGKYIIFCKNIEDMQEKMAKAREWFGNIDEDPEIYGIHSKDITSSKQLEAFNNSKSKHLKLMYCVGMIDEGVHLNDVSGVILAAKTGSRPTYFQRLGRAISSGENKKQAVVIDLVNNNEILQDKHNVEYGYELNDIEALEKLIEWIEEKNDGKLPEYSEAKSSKEKAMFRRLVRINNKYLKYADNVDSLTKMSKDKQDEIQKVLELGKTIGLFEDIVIIDFGTDFTKGIDTFLNSIEIKGVRKDFKEFLNNVAFIKSTNMQNFEEYKAWCEKNGRLPRTGIQVNGVPVRAIKEGKKEEEEQIELRLGRARTNFERKEVLTEEEEEIKRLYEELDEEYKEKSRIMQNFEEYRIWCEEHSRIPNKKIKVNEVIVKAAKKGEKETEEQIELRLARARASFNTAIKGKANLTEEEERIKQLYEELDEKYKEKSINMQNFEEYRAWCLEHDMLPRQLVRVNGMVVKAAKDGEKETEEQREQRLGKSRAKFKEKGNLTKEEKEIKRLYEELDKSYKEKSRNMKNFEEYRLWCEENSRLPRTAVKVNGIRVTSAKKGEKEAEEQRERRLGCARQTFNTDIKGKANLTEEEEEIKRGYEELDEQYNKKQPAKKIAQAIKDVPVTEAQEASEFLETITNEKQKEGVSHNDE